MILVVRSQSVAGLRFLVNRKRLIRSWHYLLMGLMLQLVNSIILGNDRLMCFVHRQAVNHLKILNHRGITGRDATKWKQLDKTWNSIGKCL